MGLFNRNVTGAGIIELKKLDQDFSVCKVKDYSLVDLGAEYCFIGKTDEEDSLECATSDVPSNVVERDDGWKGFRIQGVLDFSLIGILTGIAEILAENGISIFAISTYNTDYVLMKKSSDCSNKYSHIITEFRLPGDAGKCYLSVVLDCFDGRPVAWSVGASPTARLRTPPSRRPARRSRPASGRSCTPTAVATADGRGGSRCAAGTAW